MAIIIIAVLYIFATSSALGEEVCESESCKYLDDLRSGMNMSIDPCTDFYEYVCGNWTKNHPLPINYVSFDKYIITADRTYHQLREILETDWSDGENTAIIKAKQLYRSCIDTSAMENDKDAFLTSYLNETGGWPILMSPDEWEVSRKPLWQIINNERNLVAGYTIFGELLIEVDWRSFRQYIIEINHDYPADDLDSTDYSIDPEVALNYLEDMKEMVRIVARKQGFVIDETQIEKDCQEIIRLELSLRKIAQETMTDDPEEYMTIEEFQTFCDSSTPTTSTLRIDWLKRIGRMFALENSSIMIEGSETILVHGKEYFKRLSKFLSENSERDIVNLIQWWFIILLRDYNGSVSTWYIEEPPRWLQCIEGSQLRDVLALAWVDKYLPEGTKTEVTSIANNMKLEMENMIAQSEWLDEHSKNVAKEKLANIAIFVGYPDWYKNNSTALDESHNNLSMGTSYVENIMLIKRFELQQRLKLFRGPVDDLDWLPSPLDVNGYYTAMANSVVLPAGYLQMPLFDVDFPDVINYGGIGAIIGHEMTHGFDSNGIFFNKNGKQIKLWSDSTIQEYDSRTECFVDHYNRYGGSGQLMLTENIADFTGLTVAFKAYKKLMEKSEFRNVTLPRLNNFTAEQLFFVSFAGSYCSHEQPEYIANDDSHSVQRVRVVGALSNSKDFSDSFQCLEGSKMNPSKKCTI